MMNILYINLGEIIQFIRVSVFFQHSEDILKISWYTNNHDNFGHCSRGVKFSYLYIPTLILKQTGWTRRDVTWTLWTCCDCEHLFCPQKNVEQTPCQLCRWETTLHTWELRQVLVVKQPVACLLLCATVRHLRRSCCQWGGWRTRLCFSSDRKHLLKQWPDSVCVCVCVCVCVSHSERWY